MLAALITLAPLFGFFDDELCEVGRRAGKYRAACVGNLRLDLAQSGHSKLISRCPLRATSGHERHASSCWPLIPALHQHTDWNANPAPRWSRVCLSGVVLRPIGRSLVVIVDSLLVVAIPPCRRLIASVVRCSLELLLGETHDVAPLSHVVLQRIPRKGMIVVPIPRNPPNDMTA